LERTAQWLEEVKSIAGSNRNRRIDDKMLHQTLMRILQTERQRLRLTTTHFLHTSSSGEPQLRNIVNTSRTAKDSDRRCRMKHVAKTFGSTLSLMLRSEMVVAAAFLCHGMGHIAVARSAEPRDQIFILFGANVPHVLRPAGHDYH
jgi:hypothetical protein